ncbi:unnamed protein product, partial [Iphiclides podalirius]
MVPTPQAPPTYGQGMEQKASDRVVISGMSGLFPDSRHVQDLADILYNKKNPISPTPRWIYNHPEVAQYLGKVPNLDLFDAQFFKVHYLLGNSMDAMARKILEQAYQAIYDAGVSPEQLSGKKVGVYVGTCFSESEKSCFYVAEKKTGFGIAGCNKSMFANRISYWLNAKGPSMSIDQSCCSSIAALEQAYLALSRGDCEAAIVGGGNVCLHPQSSVHYGRIMSISMDGKTKSFDENASGCTKSEAVNVLFLQKAKDALRIYADVIHVKTEFNSLLADRTGPKYGFYRDPVDAVQFLNNFYKEARVSPQFVEYVEAFGSAVPEADKAELESLDAVFCKNRKSELLVGSVMSNIGYGEAASGISAVTKVILGYHKGVLAANLNCDNPRRDVAALRDGRMRILTEHQPFGRTYASVNGLAITGVNAHVLLHGHYKPKDLTRYKCNIPHLVTISARQDFSVKNILDYLKSRPIDPEELALLHNIHQTRISGHLGRGFTILDTNQNQQTVSLCERAEYFDDSQRPLWFVYSGMGSQWVGMGSQLMRIPIFASAIERCNRVLAPKGVDIVKIITSSDKTMFDNILHSFVGIAAIQIGLTDILRELGLVPDNIIGHSVGELGCAYADGCFTPEEMILAAYYRGLVSLQTPFIRGSMAAVGLGYKQVLTMCPSEIEVACHNSSESCTISGPADIMKQFVAELTDKQIFAKEVPCSNIAYHSRYIADAGPELLKYLRAHRKVVLGRISYNNLLNSVLFEETSRYIPSNAVVVEVAPHGLLQPILKRSLSDCSHVSLTRRGHPDIVQHLLEAIGKLYMEGYNPKVQVLYPQIEFPVSTETPFLSHLVEWAHHDKWNVPLYLSAHRKLTASCTLIYSIHDVENKYLTGNVVRGKKLFPFTAALMAAWDVLAMTASVPKKQLSVQFRDLKLHSQPTLHDQRQLRLTVSLQRGTGRFEVMDNKVKVVTGYIGGEIAESKVLVTEPILTDDLDLKSQDIYKLLSKRGYEYRDDFRSIHSANTSLTNALIYWRNNWVTLIDGMLQLNALKYPHDFVAEPMRIRKITIDIENHNNQMIPIGEEAVMTTQISEIDHVIRCGGIVIEDVTFRKLPALIAEPNLMTLKFVPYFEPNEGDITTSLLVFLQIVAENLNRTSINILELSDRKTERSNFGNVLNGLNKIPFVKIYHDILFRENILEERASMLNNIDLLLVSNLSKDDKLCQALHRILCPNMFLVNIEDGTEFKKKISTHYHVVSAQNVNGLRLELVRWRPTSSAVAASTYTLRSSSDLATISSTLATLPQQHKFIILTSYPPIDGLKEFVQKWRKDHVEIYVLMINKNSEDQFIDQLPDVNLTFNIFDNGRWGGEFFVPLQLKIGSTPDITLQTSRMGDFNSLHWTEMPDLTGSGVEVIVHYAGINKIDIQRFEGALPSNKNNNKYGMEFSGVTKRGNRVMGLINGGAVSSRVLARPELLWPVPQYWSLEDAATVPLAYSLAFYCLCIGYKISRGMNVLVHGGAGALGQAAISIALGNGCEVFTTVSDARKKRFLRKLFPELQEYQIGYSRDHTFGDMVLTATKGKGCDVVISCVADDLKNTSLKCTASFGIMFDVEHITTHNDYSYGMHNMTRGRSYSIVDLPELLQGNNDTIKMLQLLMKEGITRGYVRPLSRLVNSPFEASRAFRLLTAGRHCGRVLIQLQACNKNGHTPRSEPRLHCTSDLSHLILCNNNNFGLRIAERLVHRGARKIYLHCLSKSGYLNFEIRCLEKLGVQIKVSDAPLENKEDVRALINNCISLSQLEGIYVVRFDEQSTSKSFDVLQELDTTTRKLCPRLKYFGVISDYSVKGIPSCISRMKNNLPLTILRLLKSKKMDDVEHTTDLKTFDELAVINSFELALRSEENILIVDEISTESQSLLQGILTIAGIKLQKDNEETTTLSDLGLELYKSQIICTFLRDTHGISLSEQEIPNLSIERIKEIEKTIIDSGFNSTKGLSTFYTYIDPDELLATTEMVFLPTQMQNSTMRDDEFDVTQTFLYIVPGLEGNYERFRILCERLKVPAIVLQPGLDRPDETVIDLAQRYAEMILKKTALGQNFYLLGYESGVLVALEMAAFLEDQGLTGTIFCVGESPDKLQVTLKKELEEYKNDEELQIAVILHMCKLIVGGHTGEMEEELRRTTTWPERVKKCVNSILGRVSHSAQYARALIESAYGRIKQVQAYKPIPRVLRSKLVLMNAASSATSFDQSLQLYSQQPVTVYQLRAPLAHSSADLRCTAFINDHLSDDLLKAFDNKNLCDTYLLNAEKFMTT